MSTDVKLYPRAMLTPCAHIFDMQAVAFHYSELSESGYLFVTGLAVAHFWTAL